MGIHTPPPGATDPGALGGWDGEVVGGPWEEAELNALLDASLVNNRMQMGDTVQLTPEISITFVTLDNNATAEVNNLCRGLDIYTREQVWPRRVLARAITAINGRPVVDLLMLEKWLGRMPNAVVNAIFDKYAGVQAMQVTKMGILADALKKEPPSPLKESAGNSPGDSDVGPGTTG